MNIFLFLSDSSGSDAIGFLITALFIVIFVFAMLRSFSLWYFKINDIVNELQESNRNSKEIIELLKSKKEDNL